MLFFFVDELHVDGMLNLSQILEALVHLRAERIHRLGVFDRRLVLMDQRLGGFPFRFRGGQVRFGLHDLGLRLIESRFAAFDFLVQFRDVDHRQNLPLFHA